MKQFFEILFSTKNLVLTVERLNLSKQDNNLIVDDQFLSCYGIKIARLNRQEEFLNEAGKVIICTEEEFVDYVKNIQQKILLCKSIAAQSSFNANLSSINASKFFQDMQAIPGDFTCHPSSELDKIAVTYLNDNWELIHINYDLKYQSKQLQFENTLFNIPDFFKAAFLKKPLREKNLIQENSIDYHMQKIKDFLTPLIYASKDSQEKISFDRDIESENIAMITSSKTNFSMLPHQTCRLQRNFNVNTGLSFTILLGHYFQGGLFQSTPIYNFSIDNQWTKIDFDPNSQGTKESLLKFINSMFTKQSKNLEKDEKQETEFHPHCQ